jgi:hypothetical protein
MAAFVGVGATCGRDPEGTEVDEAAANAGAAFVPAFGTTGFGKPGMMPVAIVRSGTSNVAAAAAGLVIESACIGGYADRKRQHCCGREDLLSHENPFVAARLDWQVTALVLCNEIEIK